MHPTSRATLIGTFAPFAWATMPLMTLYIPHVPPFLLTALVFACSSVIGISVWMYKKRRWSEIKRYPLTYWLLGIWGLFGFHFCFFMMIRLAPPAEGFLLFNTWQIFLLFFSSLILKERLHRYHVIGAAMGFLGVLAIAFAKDFTSLSSEHLMGYGFALATSLIWASYSALSPKFSHIPSDAVAGYLPLTAVCALLAHLALEQDMLFALPQGKEWFALLAIALAPSGFAYFAWDYGVKFGDIRTLSILAFIEPLLAVLILILFGFAEPAWHIGVAALLIVGGAALGSIKKSEQ
jgi:drug/metabolite transporter (DMT)-like permease